MNKLIKIVIILLLLVSLIAVRAFASEIFYDPLIAFFKKNHLSETLPSLSMAKILVSTSLRFWINTAISLAIIWIIFRKKDIVKLSAFLYVIAFICLIIVFYILIQNTEKQSYMMLFYVRRFLIHPIFLLLLIPAFYFQRTSK